MVLEKCVSVVGFVSKYSISLELLKTTEDCFYLLFFLSRHSLCFCTLFYKSLEHLLKHYVLNIFILSIKYNLLFRLKYYYFCASNQTVKVIAVERVHSSFRLCVQKNDNFEFAYCYTKNRYAHVDGRTLPKKYRTKLNLRST